MASNTLRNILLIILVLILGTAVYFLFIAGPNRMPDTSQTATTTAVQDLNVGISISTLSINDKNAQKKYEIDAKYPEISGLKDQTVEKKINADLKKFIDAEIADFKLGESDTSVEPGMPDGDSTFDVSFSHVETIPHSNILSFSVAEEYYSVGAAHPGHTYIALNYDLATGNKVPLAGFLAGEYVKVLSAKSIALLKTKLGDDANQDFIKAGAGPKEENFKVFFPSGAGFKIIFNEYQVASYVAGPQEIIIPYSVLKDVINPNGPLRSL